MPIERTFGNLHFSQADRGAAPTTLPPRAGFSGDNALRRTSTGYQTGSGDNLRGLGGLEAAYVKLSDGFHAYITGVGTGVKDRAYLAWEDLRGGGAAELVGTVIAPDGKPLPYTGFEGYFAGETPEEIVAAEVKLGKYILRSIHINYGKYDALSGIPESALKTALHGGKMRPEHVGEIIKYFDCLFEDVLAMAKGASPERYAEFRRRTYQRLATGQTVTPEYINTAVIPLKDRQEEEAYTALAEIGIFGHPHIRAIHASIAETGSPAE